VRRALVTAAVVLLTACNGDEPAREDRPPRHIAVPARDASPPETVIILRDIGGTPQARASQPPAADHPQPVALREPRLRGTAVGRDPDGGVARVRVSIRERIVCRNPGGAISKRLRTRYFPPSQIERIRSSPGARLPTEVARTLPLTLAGDRCGRGDPGAVHGELWGEATNGSGLEAVTPHLRFTWRRD
jgi:hypothetical protein